jgi:ankyrin repeat protein
MWAAARGHAEVVQVLLETGADVNVKDKNGKTALMRAVIKGHKEIAEILKKSGAKE